MDHPLHSEKRSDNTQDFTILNIGHALAHTQVIATLERGHLPENLGPYTTNYEYPFFVEIRISPGEAHGLPFIFPARYDDSQALAVLIRTATVRGLLPSDSWIHY